MITNILATVVTMIVTNVVETDNHRGCETCYRKSFHPYTLEIVTPHDHPPSLGFPQAYIPATERTITKTAVIKRTLNFTLDGQGFSVPLDEKTVSTESKTLVLKQEWTEKGAK